MMIIFIMNCECRSYGLTDLESIDPVGTPVPQCTQIIELENPHVIKEICATGMFPKKHSDLAWERG